MSITELGKRASERTGAYLKKSTARTGLLATGAILMVTGVGVMGEGIINGNEDALRMGLYAIAAEGTTSVLTAGVAYKIGALKEQKHAIEDSSESIEETNFSKTDPENLI